MLGVCLVIVACAFWAIDTLIRYPLLESGIDAFSIVFYEHLLLSLISVVIFVKSFKKLWNTKISHLFYFAMVGGVGSALATLAFTRAFMYLNPSIVIILQKFQPVVAIALARFVLKERVQKEFIFWALICLGGAFLISYDDIIKIFGSDQFSTKMFFHESSLQGYVLVLFSIFGWGAATVFGKKLVQEGFTDEQIMAGRFSTGLLFLLPFASSDIFNFNYSIEVYGKISLMVFVSGLLAMYIYYEGLRRISARACTLSEMFFPFMAVIVNWLFLGTSLTTVQLVGGGILLLGSVVIQYKHY